MRNVLLLSGLCLLGGCVVYAGGERPAPSTQAPLLRGVHSGERDKIGYFYSVYPTCQSEGYPEITVVTAPSHGKVTTDQGEDYPDFRNDNVRWVCDRRLLPSTQVFYQSDPGFHGKDSFAVQVRSPNSHLRSVAYAIEVR